MQIGSARWLESLGPLRSLPESQSLSQPGVETSRIPPTACVRAAFAPEFERSSLIGHWTCLWSKGQIIRYLQYRRVSNIGVNYYGFVDWHAVISSARPEVTHDNRAR